MFLMLFFSLSPLLLYVGRFAAQVSKSSSILLVHVTIVTQTFGYFPFNSREKSTEFRQSHVIMKPLDV